MDGAPITLDACVAGTVYRLDARRLVAGVYDGAGSFIGIRRKMSALFLCREAFHGERAGSATPLEVLGVVPAEVALSERLGSRCHTCHQPCEYIPWGSDDTPNQFRGRWCHVDGPGSIRETDCATVAPTSVPNDELFVLLESLGGTP